MTSIMAGVMIGVVLMAGGLGWRVTSTRVTAPSPANHRHASAANRPPHPTRPTRLARSTLT